MQYSTIVVQYIIPGFQVSPAGAAAVASGFLKDLIAAGHLDKDMAYLALDPTKLRRAREMLMAGASEFEDARAQAEMIGGISYDGRKDKTRALAEDSNGQLHPRIIKEEHISVTVELQGPLVFQPMHS